mmetsp:Transcript_115371/g.333280  ORF Transcript_115371/g.333280 Transcript_115371/m.333280 type:complete len:211 (-) Transcript_115371:68-700(-)
MPSSRGPSNRSPARPHHRDGSAWTSGWSPGRGSDRSATDFAHATPSAELLCTPPPGRQPCPDARASLAARRRCPRQLRSALPLHSPQSSSCRDILTRCSRRPVNSNLFGHGSSRARSPPGHQLRKPHAFSPRCQAAWPRPGKPACGRGGPTRSGAETGQGACRSTAAMGGPDPHGPRSQATAVAVARHWQRSTAAPRWRPEKAATPGRAA